LVEKLKQKKETISKIKEKKSLPTISILHTGGTIASKVDYKTGAVTARFTPEEILSMFPELKDIANIRSRLITNMFSEDMRFAHYNLIANEIAKEIKKGVDGIIVTHGTDTMHYTAAALAFILENLPIPVILVGAQRSSDRPSSDAADNLISAAIFIANSNFAEVAICMHKSQDDETCFILPATKTRKMHTSRRDTFRPINCLPFATINTKTKNITLIRTNYKKRENKKLIIKPIKENIKVAILKAYPNLTADILNKFKGYDGLVIEGTGLGHISINETDKYTKENTKIFLTLKDLAKKTIIVMAPQTIYGRLQMDVYSTGRRLQEIGILGNFSDMTPETTYIKLAWLLSNYKKEDVKELICKNLRGELSERIEDNTFLY